MQTLIIEDFSYIYIYYKLLLLYFRLTILSVELLLVVGGAAIEH